ncbi:MAG: type II toxin-antitoxin system Phd/YefM family antitoxin [Desulfamplus sp.]|nr:type II toxin-antitoxin system Phd/YefM family antitoxin [Desulfamplus sp.]
MNFENIIPVTMVKKDLGNILKSITDQDETFTITQKGKAVGIIMSPEKYEGLMETMEILSDKKILAKLESSRKDFETGKIYTHEQVWQ